MKQCWKPLTTYSNSFTSCFERTIGIFDQILLVQAKYCQMTQSTSGDLYGTRYNCEMIRRTNLIYVESVQRNGPCFFLMQSPLNKLTIPFPWDMPLSLQEWVVLYETTKQRESWGGQ